MADAATYSAMINVIVGQLHQIDAAVASGQDERPHSYMISGIRLLAEEMQYDFSGMLAEAREQVAATKRHAQ